MRKILTREEREKKETRNKTVLGIILVGIMVLSTAGYAFYRTGNENRGGKIINYRGLNFTLQEDGFWHFNIQDYEFATAYNPEDTENVSSSLILNLLNYSGKILYFSDGTDLQAANEISRNIARFTERMQEACLGACEKDLPVKNCSDNIIAIREANETLINQEENCAYINAKKEDMLRVSDAFIFRILGIQ